MAVRQAADLRFKKAKVDETAEVHSFCDLVGDVRIGAHVLVSPGTSIRADEGAVFAIGDKTIVQDGAFIHGKEGDGVLGDDGQEYAVWIGKQACLAHMALIHSPVYLGDDCFVGFRSTLFNTRVGRGSVVMMHALVQDVEIPPGKYVPSGSIITSQSQADSLPDIQPRELLIVEQIKRLAQSRGSEKDNFSTTKENQYNNLVNNMGLTTEIKEQVRSLLNQGYSIGAEHADKRRFKTSSWQSLGTLTGNRIEQILQTLESYLNNHPDEYIRLIGVDSKIKKRVFESIIQRPDGSQPAPTTKKGSSIKSSSKKTVSVAAVDDNIASHVRSLLAQGSKIATEYANTRRFKTSSWQSAGIIDAKSEAEILNILNSVLSEHQGEYVRLIGIDSSAKRRVLELIIQRPGENANAAVSSSKGGESVARNSSVSNSLGADTVQKIRVLLQQGFKIGTEHADKRRFKTGSWTSCSPIESTRESDVIQSLNDCITEHQGEYVRLLGIDNKAKRRVLESIIARPGDVAQPVSSEKKETVASASVSNFNGNGKLTLDGVALAQVRSLLQQGHKIGTEHADKRRFKTSSWSSCGTIESKNESEIVSALAKCLDEHTGEYVRLIGIDPKAKRRVLETIIQRP